MFQPVHITLNPWLKVLRSPISVKGDRVGQQFEVNIIVPATPIQPEEQNDWCPQDSGNQQGTFRELCFLAKKPAGYRFLAAEKTVSQNADEFALIQTLFDRQHRIRGAGLDDP